MRVCSASRVARHTITRKHPAAPPPLVAPPHTVSRSNHVATAFRRTPGCEVLVYYPIEKRGSCVLCKDLHTFAKTAPTRRHARTSRPLHRRRPRVLASVPRRVATTTSWTSRTRHRSTRRLRPRARHRRLCRTLAGTRAPRTHSAPFTMLSSFRSSGRRASPTASPAARKSAATPVASAVVAKILCSSRRPACACCYRRCSLGKSSVVTTSLCEPRRDPRPLPPPPTSFGAFLRHQCARALRRSVSGSIRISVGKAPLDMSRCKFTGGSAYAKGVIGLGEPLSGDATMATKHDCCAACARNTVACQPTCAHLLFNNISSSSP